MATNSFIAEVTFKEMVVVNNAAIKAIIIYALHNLI